jgi:hypothetical protein
VQVTAWICNCLADANDKANIVHYDSAKFKRVTRSVMASELHGLVLEFDHAYFLKTMIYEFLNRDVPIDAFIDSKKCLTRSLNSIQPPRIESSSMSPLCGYIIYKASSARYFGSLLLKTALKILQKSSNSLIALRFVLNTNLFQVTPCRWINRTGLNLQVSFVPLKGLCEKESASVADTTIPALK